MFQLALMMKKYSFLFICLFRALPIRVADKETEKKSNASNVQPKNAILRIITPYF